MRKRVLTLTLGLTMAASLAACGGSTSSTDEAPAEATTQAVEITTEATEDTTEAVAETTVEKDFDGTGLEKNFEGEIYLVGDAGTTEDGEALVIYENTDTLMDQIELDAWDVDGSKLSYIYIDGILNDTDQLSDTQMTITLVDADLAEGDHLVEVVQFEDDDATKEVTAYINMTYTIKIQ